MPAALQAPVGWWAVWWVTATAGSEIDQPLPRGRGDYQTRIKCYKNTKISHLQMARNAEVGLGGESWGGRVDRGQLGPGAHQRSGSDNFHFTINIYFTSRC